MGKSRWRRFAVPLAFAGFGWLLLPAQSFGRALVRFVHGVPGVGGATVSITDGGPSETIGRIAFAQSTRWRSIRSGSFRWTLRGAAGRTLARGTSSVGDGAYDILVLPEGSGVRLFAYRTEAGRPGTSLVRVIHGAPELGSPELTVDGRTAVSSLAYTRATPYLPLASGDHALAAMRPGDPTPFVSAHAATAAGRAYSEVVLGSRGQRVRVVTLVDRGGPLVRPAASHHPTAPSVGSRDGRTVVVEPGESLWTIAARLAGPGASDTAIERRLTALWDANASRIGTGDPSLIFAGTRLRV